MWKSLVTCFNVIFTPLSLSPLLLETWITAARFLSWIQKHYDQNKQNLLIFCSKCQRTNTRGRAVIIDYLNDVILSNHLPLLFSERLQRSTGNIYLHIFTICGLSKYKTGKRKPYSSSCNF